jgi:hypothetical protein
MPTPTTAERAVINQLASSEKTAVNALLMAAMAMTEMSGPILENDDSCGTISKPRSTEGTTADRIEVTATTPPFNNTSIGNSNNGTPEANGNTENQFETPQRNLMGKFMSPKRKATPIEARSPRGMPMSVEPARKKGHYKNAIANEEEYDHDDDDDEYDSDGDVDSPKRQHPGDGTPGIQQKIKRSRLGSLKKASRVMAKQQSNSRRADLGSTTKPRNGGVVPMEMATPAKGIDGPTADLTPVSARCIDFKKMRVNDTVAEEAAANSGSSGRRN